MSQTVAEQSNGWLHFLLYLPGDAYMGVTNLEKNQEHSHVKQIAEFAVEMVNEARKVCIDKDDPSRGFINIRVGFHSGPEVSNVIGTTNKRYVANSPKKQQKKLRCLLFLFLTHYWFLYSLTI